MRRLIILCGIILAALVPATLTAAAAQASTQPAALVNRTAVTHLTNRPDSGAHGNTWALDTLTRTATIHRVAAVALSHCGGHSNTGFCYEFTATVSDVGTFHTIPGVDAPGFGYQNGGPAIQLEAAITGQVDGSARYTLYSSWKTDDRTPPAAEDGTPSGRLTTSDWPLLFFRTVGPQIYDSAGNPLSSGAFSILTAGAWNYLAGPGSDPACINVTSQWFDASADAWGSTPAGGNILAPDAAHC